MAGSSERFASTLPDGSRIVFRPIRPDNKERVVRGFEALSPEARYARFLSPVSRLTPAQLIYLTEVDMVDHFAWVAIADDDTGIGVGRWIRLPEEPEVAEVAITVIDRFQRQGIGHTLLWLCAWSAIRAHVEAFRVWMLGENRAAMSLMRGIAKTHGRWEDGVYVSTARLPASEEELVAEGGPPLALTPISGESAGSPVVSSSGVSGKADEKDIPTEG